MLDVSKEIEKAVTDDYFGLDPDEQVVNELKKINKSQERLVELMFLISERLKRIA